ncbi:MAG TPA: DUF2723 domain-containing protein, partial [Chthoniobacterales bacterium]
MSVGSARPMLQGAPLYQASLTCGFPAVRNDNIRMSPTLKITVTNDSTAGGDSGHELLGSVVVFFATFAVYAWTVAPTITLVDSGELALVAQGWGVAHPPGFPLWVLLAHFISLVPFGSVALRLNLASALFGAAASALATLVTAELILAMRPSPVARSRRDQHRETTNSLARLLPAMSAGLLFGFSRTLWSYATITEVYTLNSALILWIVFLMLRWRRTIQSSGGTTAAKFKQSNLPLYLAAGLFGLALGAHHVTVGLILPALALLVYRTAGSRYFASRRFAYAALISLAAAILVYSYLPIAASHAPLINWGTPLSAHAIWAHFTGRQYQSFLAFEPAMAGPRLLEVGRMIIREFSRPWLPVALLLAVVGFWAAFKKDRVLFWFLGLLVAANLAYGMSYSISEDKDAYYVTSFAAVAIAAGTGLHWLFCRVLSKFAKSWRVNVIAIVALLLVPAIAGASNWRFNNRRHYWIAHDYVANIFRSVERGGLLLTFDWQVASPMFYAQQVERRRRDVKIVDINLLRRSWYFDYLRRVYPGFIARSAGPVEA